MSEINVHICHMIKIEKNIPFETAGRGVETGLIKEMMLTMEVGDSTIIETDNQSRFSCSLTRIPKRANSTVRFKTLKIENNKYRVWRIK